VPGDCEGRIPGAVLPGVPWKALSASDWRRKPVLDFKRANPLPSHIAFGCIAVDIDFAFLS
jgi:hypothetical protein